MFLWKNVLFFMFICIANLVAQDSWHWGWSLSNKSEKYHYFDNTIQKQSTSQSIHEKLIWFYKNKVAPLHTRQCPFYPSCSTYTLYSMEMYGFVMGLFMGMDRLYFRENPDPLKKRHYNSVLIYERQLAYDPPEANYVFGQQDWRIIHPDFYPLFFK